MVAQANNAAIEARRTNDALPVVGPLTRSVMTWLSGLGTPKGAMPCPQHHRLEAPSRRQHRRSTERGRSSFLVVLSDEPLQDLGQLKHAGEILLGESSVLTLGNYL